MSLNLFFEPNAIAVIGASNKQHKIGRQILDNVITGGFKKRIYPINLKEKKIANLKAYSSIEKLPLNNFSSLLTIIAIPAPFVLDEIRKCAKVGVKNVIIISAGFKERSVEGAVIEKEIQRIATKHKMSILGPNCLGMINTKKNINATFTKVSKQTGRIALLSQSGAIGSAVLDWLEEKNLGLAYFVSLGNKAVINENDVFKYLINDSQIDLVVAYLEEIKEGKELMNLVSRLAQKKPVAILKAGQSVSGKKLALSHTGSMAGSSEATKAGLIRAGAIYLENLEELFSLITLSKKEYWLSPGTNDLYIVSNAGGMVVLSADEMSKQQLELGGSFDVLGDADAKRYQKILESLLKDKKVNNILVLLTPQTTTEPLKTAQAIVRLAKRYPEKLIITSFLGGKTVFKANQLLVENNIPTFNFPKEAIQGFKRIVSYRKNRKNHKIYTDPVVSKKRMLESIDYIKSFALLKKYGIKTVETVKYDSKKLKSLQYPVVVKMVGPDFVHKSDKQAVVVNIENKETLKKIVASLERQNKKQLAKDDNYLILQPQINSAQEIILGIKRDPAFGPLIVVGMGGIYTEIFKDIRLEIADLDLSKAKEMIRDLKLYPILSGARGKDKYDVNELAKAVVNLARLANEHPEIKELDINPLFVKTKGVQAGDVRIVV